jgi:hypothetical protein
VNRVVLTQGVQGIFECPTSGPPNWCTGASTGGCGAVSSGEWGLVVDILSSRLHDFQIPDSDNCCIVQYILQQRVAQRRRLSLGASSALTQMAHLARIQQHPNNEKRHGIQIWQLAAAEVGLSGVRQHHGEQ